MYVIMWEGLALSEPLPLPRALALLREKESLGLQGLALIKVG